MNKTVITYRKATPTEITNHLDDPNNPGMFKVSTIVNVVPDPTINDILYSRPDKLKQAMAYIQPLVNANQFDIFLSDSRAQLQDYLHGSNNLITWLNVTFPTKAYFNSKWQTDLLAILS